MSEDNAEKKKEPQTNFDNETLQRLLKEAETRGKLEAEKSGTVHPQPSTLTNEKDHFLVESYNLIFLGKFEEAIECFDKVLGTDPNNAKALAYKGTALSGLGNYKEALEFFNKALEIDPTNKEAISGILDKLRLAGKYKEALEFCDKTLHLDPNNETALYFQTQAMLGLGKFKEILESSEKILEIKPADTEALHLKARALGGLGRIHEAVICIKKALEIQPNDPRFTIIKPMLNSASNIGKDDEAQLEMRIYDMYDRIMNPTTSTTKMIGRTLFGSKIDKKKLFKMGVESFLNFSE